MNLYLFIITQTGSHSRYMKRRMRMEKISREELLKKMSLSLDELEKISGGAPEGFDSTDDCVDHYYNEFMACIDSAKKGYEYSACIAAHDNAMANICNG